MSEQPSPEELSENALICEKLLGLKYLERLGPWKSGWYRDDGTFVGEVAPSFSNWAEAGLILEALDKGGDPSGTDVDCGNAAFKRWYCDVDGHVSMADTGPHAIRTAALRYIKTVQS